MRLIWKVLGGLWLLLRLALGLGLLAIAVASARSAERAEARHRAAVEHLQKQLAVGIPTLSGPVVDVGPYEGRLVLVQGLPPTGGEPEDSGVGVRTSDQWHRFQKVPDVEYSALAVVEGGELSDAFYGDVHGLPLTAPGVVGAADLVAAVDAEVDDWYDEASWTWLGYAFVGLLVSVGVVTRFVPAVSRAPFFNRVAIDIGVAASSAVLIAIAVGRPWTRANPLAELFAIPAVLGSTFGLLILISLPVLIPALVVGRSLHRFEGVVKNFEAAIAPQPGDTRSREERLRAFVQESSLEGSSNDPAEIHDPLARTIEWRPMRAGLRGGADFATHTLSDDSVRLKYRTTWSFRAFCGAFVAAGLAAMTAGAGGSDGFGLEAVAGVVLALAGAFAYWSTGTPSTFDRASRRYWTGHRRPAGGARTSRGLRRACRFDEIYALQLLYPIHPRIRKEWPSAELNLVLRDGERVPVVRLHHSWKVIEDAERIAAMLDRPLWRARPLDNDPPASR